MEGVICIIGSLSVISFILYEYIAEKNLINILSSILYRKASKEIEEYLNNNQTITFSEAREIVSKLKASVFWSRKSIIINDPLKYTSILLESMVNQGRLLYYEYDSNKVYMFKEKP